MRGISHEGAKQDKSMLASIIFHKIVVLFREAKGREAQHARSVVGSPTKTCESKDNRDETCDELGRRDPTPTKTCDSIEMFSEVEVYIKSYITKEEEKRQLQNLPFCHPLSI